MYTRLNGKITYTDYSKIEKWNDILCFKWKCYSGLSYISINQSINAHTITAVRYHSDTDYYWADIYWTQGNIPHCLNASSEPQSPALRAATSCHLHSVAADVLLHMPCVCPHPMVEPSCLCLQQWNAANQCTASKPRSVVIDLAVDIHHLSKLMYKHAYNHLILCTTRRSSIARMAMW